MAFQNTQNISMAAGTTAASQAGFFSGFDRMFGFIAAKSPFLKALYVFLIFLGFAFFIRLVFVKVLQRLVKGTKTKIDDKIIETVKGPVLLTVIFAGLFESGRVLGMHARVAAYNKLFMTVFSLFVFWAIFKIIIIVLYGLRERFSRSSLKIFDNKVFPIFEKFLKFIIFVFFLFSFFDIWKINLAPLIASAGIAGLAVAFAAQETIANMFSGISLFLDKAYEIGDYIIIDEKYRGEIIDIGLRSTKLKTRDDVMIVVPNSILANSKILNESGIHPKLRVRIKVDVAYGTDLDKVEKLLLSLAKKKDYIEKTPEPRVRFRSFGDYGIGLEFLFWIKKPAYKGLYTSYAIKDVYKLFNKNNIEIPYPTHVLIKK